MTDTITHAETRLIDDLAAQREAVSKLPAAGTTDHESVQRESGFLEALEHLARRKGLSLAGVVEAQKIVAASRDWVVEMTGGASEGRGRA